MVIARNTCTILHHTLHANLFFGHNFCVLAPNDSRFREKVSKIIYYPKIDPNLKSHLPIGSFLVLFSTHENEFTAEI